MAVSGVADRGEDDDQDRETYESRKKILPSSSKQQFHKIYKFLTNIKEVTLETGNFGKEHVPT